MKKLFIILLVIIITFSIIILPPLLNRYLDENGFKRHFSNAEVKLTNTFRLDNNLYSLTGQPDREILLRNFNNPFTIFNIDYNLSKLNKIRLNLPKSFGIKIDHTQIKTQPTNIYIKSPNGNIFLVYNNQPNLYFTGLNFDQAQVVSNKSLIIRTKEIADGHNKRVLEKVLLSEKRSTISNRYTLPKQVDGIFCTDGWLQYDFKKAKIYYLYAYRGEFLILDTNLHVIKSIKTIDTVHTAKINLGNTTVRLGNGLKANQSSQITPPNVVNRGFCSNGDFIYILSNVKADNEKADVFYKNQPVDVYSLKLKKYVFSFYLPKFMGLKPRQIEINRNTIIAIYDNYLITFVLEKPLQQS